MRGKNIIIAILSLLFIPNTFAFEAYLSSSEEIVNKNNNFSIKIEVINEDNDETGIEELEIIGLENFDLISRSQYQNSSTSIKSLNGNVETITKNINSIILTLNPKNEGEFILGPVLLKGIQETKETNSINITVKGNKDSGNKIEEIQNIIDINSPIKNKNELPNKYSIYFLIFGLLVVLLIISIIYYKKKEDTKLNSILLKKEINKDNDKEDFEEIKKIVYPKIDDVDFLNKIENIFKSKIYKKYSIKITDDGTYRQILEGIDNNVLEKEIIEEIIEKIYKLKYSNILISKRELLDLIKKI